MSNPPGECRADDPEPVPHEFVPIFSAVDPDHPIYLQCSCGDVFRVDYIGQANPGA